VKPKRAIIPLAGLASSTQPQSPSQALLPIPGHDGSLRPAVDWIVREVLTSGVDEVVLIVSPRDGDLIRRYFDEPPQGTLAGAGGRRILHAWSELKEFSNTCAMFTSLNPVVLVMQCSNAGKLCSYPFILLLGDHLYRSRSTVSVRQVIDTGVQFGKGVLGVSRCCELRLVNVGWWESVPLISPESLS